MDIIASVCAGLIIVNAADNQVRLIHYSTQTYLESVQSIIFPHSQNEITLTCLTCLACVCLAFERFSSKLEASWHIFGAYPFLAYTSIYCLVHAHGKPETEIQEQILQFLENCSAWWGFWNLHRWGEKLGPDKLLIALAFGLEIISHHILRTEGPGRSLQETASRGDTNAVWFLLENVENEGGTFLNAEGGQHGSALGAAAWNRHESVVRLLIEHGANINAGVGEYGSTLQAAVWKEHGNIIQLLLEHSPDINAEGGLDSSTLQTASRQGNEAVVKLLLEHGANVNAGGREYGGALQALALKRCT
jgi:hypothetical protein